MNTIPLIALAILVLYFLFVIVVGVHALVYALRRKNNPIRSRPSHLLGEDV